MLAVYRVIITGVLAAALVTVPSVRAETTLAEKCAQAKQKAAAKKLSSKLKCYAKAAKQDAALDIECLDKAEEQFNEAFAKAEAVGGCVTTNNAASVENGVDTFLSYLLSATSSPPCSMQFFNLCGGSCPLGTTCRGLYSGGFLIACQCEVF
jgi:pantothenate synthetase